MVSNVAKKQRDRSKAAALFLFGFEETFEGLAGISSLDFGLLFTSFLFF